MKCDEHPENEAIAMCINCQKNLCDECKVIINGKNYCQECSENIVPVKIKTKNDKSDEMKTNNESDFEKNVKSLAKSSEKAALEIISKIENSFFKDKFAEIKKAKELLDMGAITEEEFNEIKRKYLK